MTLDDAQKLTALLSDVLDDWPTAAHSLCTCSGCMQDYQERLTHAFPQFVWTIVPDPDEQNFGTLTVRAREDSHADSE